MSNLIIEKLLAKTNALTSLDFVPATPSACR